VRGIRAFALWLVGTVVMVGAVIGVAMGALTRATEAADGTTALRRNAEPAAERLSDDLGHRTRARDAEYVAATEIPEELPGSGDTRLRLTAVAWSGRIHSDDKATVDVRFEEAGLSGGAAVCFRFTLQMYRYTEYKAVDCPEAATPPSPSASPPPALPPDARKRLAAVLRTATPETLAGLVRAAFPDGMSVDTATEDGVLVAAVGVPAERDCVVVIRTPDGKTKDIGFDRIWLEPGEMGCGTGLYTHPPR
jgi:hypothetical protein